MPEAGLGAFATPAPQATWRGGFEVPGFLDPKRWKGTQRGGTNSSSPLAGESAARGNRALRKGVHRPPSRGPTFVLRGGFLLRGPL
mmetsp:Transcript_52733/g.64621  ORF Transcript_52733/g.64621 Transcript_52733/m.64621 type:complete len:86 (+) Transcript_52733:169-426(+)